MRKIILLFLGAIYLCGLSAASFAQRSPAATPPESITKEASSEQQQQPLKVEMKVGSQVVEEVSSLENEMIGRIDWENNIVYAVGDGVPPKDAISPAQARARAKRAAMDEGYARLLETIQEVRVDAESTTRNFVNENRVVQTRVSGLVKNAEIEELRQASDGSYQIKMKMPLTGAKGLSSSILPVQLSNVRRVQIVTRVTQQTDVSTEPAGTEAQKTATVTEQNNKVIDEPKISEKTLPSEPKADDSAVSDVAAKYTSLVVDAKGLQAKPALYPVIRTQGGEIVYNLEKADPNATIAEGLCSYKKSLDDARKMSKAGNNPMIVTASGIGGKYGADILVSDEDGRKILAADTASPFLKDANVIVVID